ncbi:helix-turn-helix domain-containing protein [Terasakiella sp. SH-1]|uniref:helix-turn-helix domain-containing protein n=1 Tax=Terasakiella sp. SH-1 TaxID=2560057 RepID=UPI001074742F|nr:helix-turn-helix domain-containing protein [Terasakiella sp. SH-1]
MTTNPEPEGRQIPVDPDALLFPSEAAYLRGQSVNTLANERVKSGGCPFVKLGRSIRYRRADVLQWIANNSFSSTSEAGVCNV